MLPLPVTGAVPELAGSAVPVAQAGTTATNGGLAAFLGVTALVLTGFLVLARLSQRVVDDAETAEAGERVRVPRPAPGEPTPTEPLTDADGEDPSDDRRGSTPREPPAEESAVAEAGPDPVAEDHLPASVSDDRPPASIEARPSVRPEGEAASRAERTQTGSAPPGRDPGDGEGVDGMASIPPGALLANVAVTQGLFGGVLAAAAWFFQVPGTALGFSGGRVEGLAAVALGLGFGAVLWVGNEGASALADAAGAGYDEGLRQLLAPADARGWAILLGGVLPVVALVEEFIFRAAAVGAASVALGGAGGATGAWALAVASSLAFALGHGAQGRVGVVVTGALGFVLAAGFLLSGSFVVVVVAHYVVNALEFLVHEGAGLPDPVWA